MLTPESSNVAEEFGDLPGVDFRDDLEGIYGLCDLHGKICEGCRHVLPSLTMRAREGEQEGQGTPYVSGSDSPGLCEKYGDSRSEADAIQSDSELTSRGYLFFYMFATGARRGTLLERNAGCRRLSGW